MTQDAASPPAGWYGTSDGRERWWDGTTWGEQYRGGLAPTPPPPPPVQPHSKLLDDAVETLVQGGGVIESLTPTQAVLIFGRKPNHVLHLVLTLITLGLWLLVWLVAILGNSQVRVILTVLPDGTLDEKRVPIRS